MRVYLCSAGVMAALCLALTMNVRPVRGAWVNSYDGRFTFTCPKGQFLQNVVSVYKEYYRDRRFYLSCSRLPRRRSDVRPACHWHNEVNQYQEAVLFRCPGQGYMAGMSSSHDNCHEDRRFSFYCCDIAGVNLSHCATTRYVNGFYDLSGYTVPDGKVLKGISSYHNHKKDRRFKYEACQM